jgi:PhnB protein
MSESNQMKLNTYVNYKGNCKEAFQFYEEHLGGKITMISTFNDMPDKSHIPGGHWEEKILHAQIEIGNGILMGADVPNAEPMRSAYLSLNVNSDEEAERIYNLLTDGGEVFMKIGKTFFSSRFAMLRDKFGTNWMLLCEK